jgi:hypothetical protein
LIDYVMGGRQHATVGHENLRVAPVDCIINSAD